MSALPDIASVEILEGCKPDEIPAHVYESEVPIVLKGLVEEWPAVQACRQSLPSAARYLSNFWTDRPVTVLVSDGDIDGRFFYNEDCTGFNFKGGSVQLGLVFHKLAEHAENETAQTIYVGSTAVDTWLPGFREQNDVVIPSDDLVVSAWMGNRSRISAHFDFPDNVACVVAGRRRFTLFPPDPDKNLYIGPVDLTPAGQAISLVDFTNPDFDRFPNFAEALESACTYELEPGDAIFVPSMWWHQVESLSSFNMLVNYWWCSTPAIMGAPMDALMHAILSIREIPQPQRDIWKALFDHYVFSADESVYAHIPEPGRGCLAPMDKASAGKLRAEINAKLNR
jgi:hypothetical protein